MSQAMNDVVDLIWQMSEAVVLHLPTVIVALLLLAIGWMVARVMRGLARLLTRRIEKLLRKRTGAEQTREQKVASHLVSDITFWVVFLMFAAASLRWLEVPVLNEALSRAAIYLPSILGASFVLIAAFFLADLVKRGVISAATSSGLAYADLLGQVTKTLVLIVAIVLALDLLRVNSTILVTLLGIVFGAFLFGAAFAFGLGARTTVGNILASHYLSQNYRVGQTIKVRDVTGRIVDIKPSGVVLDAPEGRVLVPAATVNDSITVLVEGES